MRGRVFKAVCAIMALAVLLSGCSFIGAKNKLSVTGTKLAGQVTGVNDKTVTMKLGFITESAAEETADAATATDTTQTAQPADASASPAPTQGVSAEAPSVNDESDAIKAQQQPQAGESPAPTDNAASEGADTGDASDTADAPEAVKGVDANVATFTLGNTVAAVEIKDTSVLFKADGKTAAAITDITEGSVLEITFDAKSVITRIVIRDIPRLITSEGVNYLAANEYDSDTEVSSQTIQSTAVDETAVIVDNGAEVGFDSVTLDRSSDASTGGDASADYGVGAALLTSNGKSYIRKSTINTDAAGATGIFAYGSGKIYAADTTISTKQDASAGLSAAAGGKLYGFDMTAETSGAYAPAINGGKGGGKLILDGGLFTTNGTDSPAVSSSANVAVNGATLTANASGAARVSGANALYIFDSALSGAMAADDKNSTAWTVCVYGGTASASDGRGAFKMVGGSIKTTGAGLIYTTNTQSDILLSGVDLGEVKDSAFLLRCTGNSGFGENGKNGAQCVFTASAQEMSGDIIWDSISTLDFYMADGSKLTGAVKNDETYAGDKKGGGHCDMYIGDDSTWVVTGDSKLTNLYSEGKIVDKDGKTVTIKDSDGKRLVRGASEYTVTVENYKSSADLAGALAVPQWKDYQVTRPTGM